MTTAAALIDECLGHLLSGTREQLNTLSSAITDTTSTGLSLTYDLRAAQIGSVIAIDQEIMYVVATSGLGVTVVRGFGGSTAATHLINSRVWVNPKFSRFRILQAMNNELLALSSRGLYKQSYVDLTYSPSFQGYDLTGVTAIEDVIAVQAQRLGGLRQWDTLGRTDWQIQRDMPTTVFASGFALMLLRGDPGQTVRVLYRAPFGSLATEATDPQHADVGFPATANDILPLGAAIRLVLPREVSRNFHETQGEPRRAEEVQSGANVRAAAALMQLYDERVRDEAKRLQRKYPLRRYA